MGICTDDFDGEELELAKKQITEGKASGEDGIPPEVLKRTDLDGIVLDFCNTMTNTNRALRNGEIPEHSPCPEEG